MGNDNGVLDKNGNYYDYELMPSSFNEFYFELIKDFNEKKKIKVTFYYANNPKKLFKTIQLHYQRKNPLYSLDTENEKIQFREKIILNEDDFVP